MPERKPYNKRSQYLVTAVQLDLDFHEFNYQKWGGAQTAKPGDWLVNNDGDVYTVDDAYFRKNYREINRGVFEKVGAIWAERATEDGVIKTHEGTTCYKAGDYLVFDRHEGGEGYAIEKDIFAKMYSEQESKKHE